MTKTQNPNFETLNHQTQPWIQVDGVFAERGCAWYKKMDAPVLTLDVKLWGDL